MIEFQVAHFVGCNRMVGYAGEVIGIDDFDVGIDVSHGGWILMQKYD
jgi:hypothetical protein